MGSFLNNHPRLETFRHSKRVIFQTCEMPASSTDKVLTPEIVRILKIFGFVSILLVMGLSFFNEKRANNSGAEPSPMRMTDADRIYFRNVRSIAYDIEILKEAKMVAYRHAKRSTNPHITDFPLAILINQPKDEAYLYWEFSVDSLPIVVSWNNPGNGESGEIRFEGGDKFAHLAFGEEIFPLLSEEDVQFGISFSDKNFEVLSTEGTRKPVLTSLSDYFKMINSLEK